MLGRNHVPVGVAAWLVAAHALGQPALSAWTFGGAALAGVGALLPDLDHPHSIIGRRAPILSWPLRLLAGHRGFTHSALGVAAAGWGLWQLVSGLAAHGWLTWCLVPLLVGYLSHLVADACTEGGVALWWPLPGRVHLLPRLIAWETGSLIEYPVAWAALVGAVALVR